MSQLTHLFTVLVLSHWLQEIKLLVPFDQGRINHSGPHTNVRRGPFLVREARIFLSVAVHFFPKKVDDFLVVVTFKRTLNVQTSKQRGKNLAVDRRVPLPWYNRHNG